MKQVLTLIVLAGVIAAVLPASAQDSIRRTSEKISLSEYRLIQAAMPEFERRISKREGYEIWVGEDKSGVWVAFGVPQ